MNRCSNPPATGPRPPAPPMPRDGLAARGRVLAAADVLFEQSNRQVIPHVDEVRKLACVDMDQASRVMLEWRMSHRGLTPPSTCPHKYVSQGVAAWPSQHQQPGSSARARVYADAYFCEHCLERKFLNEREMGNTYEPVLFNAVGYPSRPKET